MTHLYEQELLQHYRTSSFKGRLQNPSWVSDSCNPSCGDVIRFEGIVADDYLSQVMFDGAGCVISQATASLLAHKIVGRPIQEIENLTSCQVIALVKIPLGPTRSRCALLSFEALTGGLAKYRENQKT
jgi:nitrogen fixation protein NifU and related proteins